MLALDLVQTLALAGVVLFLGYGIKRRIPLLSRYNIPAPVVGGLLVAALLSLAHQRGHAPVTFDATLQTPLQNGITVSDLPGPTGGIMLKSATGATLIVNDTGIYIQNGKGASLVMTGPTVTVNNGALVVT